MKKLRVTVNSVIYDVDVEILEDDDHPGYGYAAVPEAMKIVWQKELENYLIRNLD